VALPVSTVLALSLLYLFLEACAFGVDSEFTKNMRDVRQILYLTSLDATKAKAGNKIVDHSTQK
jgi:hypothetical protein